MFVNKEMVYGGKNSERIQSLTSRCLPRFCPTFQEYNLRFFKLAGLY